MAFEWNVATIGLLVAGLGFLFFITRKPNQRDARKQAGYMIGIGAVVFFIGGGLAMIPAGDGEPFTIGVDAVDTDAVDCALLDSITIKARNKYTQAGTGEDFEWYDLGADVTKSTTTELYKVDVSSGTVTDTTAVFLNSCDTEDSYDLYFEGSTTYYNELIPDWSIRGNPDTGKGTVYFGDALYYDAKPFGTLADLDTASATSGSVQDWYIFSNS